MYVIVHRMLQYSIITGVKAILLVTQSVCIARRHAGQPSVLRACAVNGVVSRYVSCSVLLILTSEYVLLFKPAYFQ